MAVDQRFEPGTPITVQTTKWGDHPHWSYDGSYLGADEFGDWLGFPAGTYYARPGRQFTADFDCVSLVPRTDAAHFAGFYRTDHPVAIYVDVTTPPEWHDRTVTMVDLDLDVIKMQDETLYIDDEDEFEEHQIVYGYPPEIIALAEESAERVFAGASGASAPYDGSHERWMDVMASLPR